jgi:hypothetical protein
MFEILFLLVVGTTIWMTMESAQKKIPIDKKPYGVNNGALAWCLSGILLWIATFPWYLIQRGRYLAQPTVPLTPSPVQRPAVSVADELAKLHDLKTSGAITEGDYERAKSRLLA